MEFSIKIQLYEQRKLTYSLTIAIGTAIVAVAQSAVDYSLALYVAHMAMTRVD